MRQGHHPGSGAAELRIEPRGGPPDVEQDLLHDLLGLCQVTDDPAHDPEYLARGLLIDCLEGGLVSARDVSKQDSESRIPPALPRRTPQLTLPLTLRDRFLAF